MAVGSSHAHDVSGGMQEKLREARTTATLADTQVWIVRAGTEHALQACTGKEVSESAAAFPRAPDSHVHSLNLARVCMWVSEGGVFSQELLDAVGHLLLELPQLRARLLHSHARKRKILVHTHASETTQDNQREYRWECVEGGKGCLLAV